MSYFLRFPLVCPLVLVVDPGEVGDDDGDGQRDDEHARQRADAADQLPQHRLRDHVAVPEAEANVNNGTFRIRVREIRDGSVTWLAAQLQS